MINKTKVNVGDKVIVFDTRDIFMMDTDGRIPILIGDEVEVTKIENLHTGKRGRPRKLFTCVKEDVVFSITSDKVAKAKIK